MLKVGAQIHLYCANEKLAKEQKWGIIVLWKSAYLCIFAYNENYLST